MTQHELVRSSAVLVTRGFVCTQLAYCFVLPSTLKNVEITLSHTLSALLQHKRLFFFRFRTGSAAFIFSRRCDVVFFLGAGPCAGALLDQMCMYRLVAREPLHCVCVWGETGAAVL